MSPADLNALADRVEAAEASETRDLLEEAFGLIKGARPNTWVNEDDRENWTPEYAAWAARGWLFRDFIDAEAYVDAALMLVPEGEYSLQLGWCPEFPSAWCLIFPPDDMAGVPDEWKGRGKSIALAICAAALRAHGEQT